ncbi:MAG: amidohydrolase [Chloroflexi bacterium]|nr:amidohydrolase [Chloroflexota bacterium]
MTETLNRVEQRGATEVAVNIVDVDVHPAPRTAAELKGYLPREWQRQEIPERVFDPVESPLYVAPNKAQRSDAQGPDGGPPASDPAFTEKQLFQDAGVDYAIHIPLTVRAMANQQHEAAVAAATNNWLAETWLSKYNQHGRYRGTLRICSGDPQLAAAEIERWAGHPYFVQVMVTPYVRAPYGQASYYPIYEAAARHNLPIAMHVNRSPGMGLLTPVGYASYFFEHHTLYPLLYAAHFTSLIAEGVFERFPTLKFVFIEGGFSWLVPLVWRLDQHWTELRSEIPNVKRRPSEYLAEHIRFTSQPIEEPADERQLLRVLDWLAGDRILMFATDYPHWDGDYEPRQLFRGLAPEARQRIFRDNALELYGLPATRPG